MNRAVLQIDQPQTRKLRIKGRPFRRPPWTLTTSREMTIKPLTDIRVDFPKSLAGISTPKIVGPATQMFVEFFDQSRDRLKAHPRAGQLSKVSPLTGQCLLGGEHTQVPKTATFKIKVVPERVPQKIQAFPCPAQVQHLRLFPVQLQTQPCLDLRFNPAHDSTIHISRQHHKVSRPREPPPQPLSEPGVNLSVHRAPIIQPTVSRPTANAETARIAFRQFFPTNAPPYGDGVSTFYISSLPT